MSAAVNRVCPACGRLHAVSAERARLAYGRAVACSAECEVQRRQRSRERYPHLAGPLTACAAASALVLLPGRENGAKEGASGRKPQPQAAMPLEHAG
jgi:hypothetical protein